MNRTATALADHRTGAAPPARPATVRALPRPLSEEQAWARAAANRSGFGASETALVLPPSSDHFTPSKVR